MSMSLNNSQFSAYLHFSREQWCRYRQNMPLTLTEDDLEKLHGVNEIVSLTEVEDVYLPLSRLLNLYVSATQSLHQVTGEFLGSPEPKVPYIIGVAGSVAVGKSTTSRILQALLSRWPDHPNVQIVSTDGFIFPNAELERLGMMHRKGFPESYDLSRLLTFLREIKSGKEIVEAPVYSHHVYDIVPEEMVTIHRPDILIIEGLNILQTGSYKIGQVPQTFVSDFFDFSLFVDAEIETVRQWYVDRVITFTKGPFAEPDNYFHYLTKMTPEELVKFAERVWREINEINLIENIVPFKNRARLILWKDQDHAVQNVFLRKL